MMPLTWAACGLLCWRATEPPMSSKQPRPSNRRPIGDRMKVHLRIRQLAGRTMRILSLRPGTAVRYSTNRCHETFL